jgi:ubiquinone/menaquinone biosynthesis C-methylase UbiE
MHLTEDGATCTECGWSVTRVGRVFSDSAAALVGSFDEKFEGLDDHNHHPVVWELCYRRQSERIRDAISSRLQVQPGAVVLDIGCGPSLPYDRPTDAVIVGIDTSLPALRANAELDVAVHTSAARLPIGDGTVDVILANYAIHHMIGRSVAESWANVERAFSEMARVTKPGAVIGLLEICPIGSIWPLELMSWRALHRVVGAGIDFVFWPEKKLARLGASVFPGASLTVERFTVSPLATFPPVISLPKLRIPRLLYPFRVCMLTWTRPI